MCDVVVCGCGRRLDPIPKYVIKTVGGFFLRGLCCQCKPQGKIKYSKRPTRSNGQKIYILKVLIRK